MISKRDLKDLANKRFLDARALISKGDIKVVSTLEVMQLSSC